MELDWQKANPMWSDEVLRNKRMLAAVGRRLRVVLVYRGLKDSQNQFTLQADNLGAVDRWVQEGPLGRYYVQVFLNHKQKPREILMSCTFESGPKPVVRRAEPHQRLL
jgi:hypothetical protein